MHKISVSSFTIASAPSVKVSVHKISVSSFAACVALFGAMLQAQTSPAITNHAGMAMPSQSGPVTTVLSGTLGSRSASGSATLNDKVVQLVWSGDTPGSVRVWSVRSGPCSIDGSLVAATSNYSSIATDAKGNGTASATLSGLLDLSDAFHIAVYASVDAGAERIACGSLSSGTAVGTHQMNGMSNMQGASDMAGMDHSKMPGMDHSKMPGMDHSKMAGMDHSQMAKTDSSMAGMDHSAIAAVSAPGTKMSDSTSAILLLIHQRMMTDPVIRERVMTDPALQRLMEQLSGMDMAATGADMTTTMPGMTNAPAGDMKRATATSTKKLTTAPAKPVVKAPSKKPAMAPMPAMDHSKMPGMKKPPV